MENEISIHRQQAGTLKVTESHFSVITNNPAPQRVGYWEERKEKSTASGGEYDLSETQLFTTTTEDLISTRSIDDSKINH